jgi:hypothetical protein
MKFHDTLTMGAGCVTCKTGLGLAVLLTLYYRHNSGLQTLQRYR